MTQASEVVKRLREIAHFLRSEFCNTQCDEYDKDAKATDEAASLIESQEAEIKRLREALKKIADEEPLAIGHSWGHTYVREFVGIAREALKQKE